MALFSQPRPLISSSSGLSSLLLYLHCVSRLPQATLPSSIPKHSLVLGPYLDFCLYRKLTKEHLGYSSCVLPSSEKSSS